MTSESFRASERGARGGAEGGVSHLAVQMALPPIFYGDSLSVSGAFSRPWISGTYPIAPMVHQN
jgi:hypothetical protein